MQFPNNFLLFSSIFSVSFGQSVTLTSSISDNSVTASATSTLATSTSSSSAALAHPTSFPEGKCFKKNRVEPTPSPKPVPPKPKQKKTQQSIPAPPPSNMPAMGGDTDGCIALQNQARLQVGLPPMRWDAQLASTAQAWANHLYTYKLGMVHSSGQGQNLYLGSGECKGAYSAWVVNEKPKYAVGAPIDKWGDFESYGHYTQIVYKSTDRAGCSIPHANGGYFVCHYLGQQISGTAAY